MGHYECPVEKGQQAASKPKAFQSLTTRALFLPEKQDPWVGPKGHPRGFFYLGSNTPLEPARPGPDRIDMSISLIKFSACL
jgi:hypothetical protein